MAVMEVEQQRTNAWAKRRSRTQADGGARPDSDARTRHSVRRTTRPGSLPDGSREGRCDHSDDGSAAMPRPPTCRNGGNPWPCAARSCRAPRPAGAIPQAETVVACEAASHRVCVSLGRDHPWKAAYANLMRSSSACLSPPQARRSAPPCAQSAPPAQSAGRPFRRHSGDNGPAASYIALTHIPSRDASLSPPP